MDQVQPRSETVEPTRPTVFVSSTVFDFQDLRGALKYLLEENGYRVQMSDFADFEKPINRNSYDACFDAIRSSNVFVLLVGDRRGGWHDEAKRISITQAEYRVAYEQAKLGALSLVACVRSSTWDQAALFRKAPDVRSVPAGQIQDP